MQSLLKPKIKTNKMFEQKDFLALEGKIVDKLKTVFDPEMPVNIYEMGLIYEILIDEKSVAHIKMTVTSPNCPVAETLPNDVYNAVKTVEGISDVIVKMTFDPPWDQDRMSDAAKLELGLL
jgi:FeS assembly SUF system protein